MKKFIFLTPSITNMGGSEMFTYNKWRYLTSHGWDVDVFYFKKGGHFYLKELEKFKSNCIPELIYGLSYLSIKEQEKILERLLANVSIGDEVVVESHLLNLSFWGELIAAKTGGKNILNCMEENIRQISRLELGFIEYKMKRMEILNASHNSFRRYYGQLFNTDYEQYVHSYMKPFCSNVVSHAIVSDVNVEKADFNILSIGRLEKAYVIPSLIEVKGFVEKHPESTFNLIIIGGDPQNKVEPKIKNEFKGLTNIHLVFLGYMYPIPSNLITMNDVAIASANSVLVASNEGVPTIAIDINDNQPLGIYGKNAFNLFSRDGNPKSSIAKLLEDVLVRKIYSKTIPNETHENEELEEVFCKQVEFLTLSPGDGMAYDVNGLYPGRKKIVDRTKFILHKLGL